MLHHPHQRGITILNSGGKRMFGSQSPIDRDDDTPHVFDKALAQMIIHSWRAHEETAAMNP